MSFIRYIYNTFFKKLIDKSWTLNDALNILEHIKDIKSGKYIDSYEKKELKGSIWLSQQIDSETQLLPEVQNLLNGKRGPELKESLFQHKTLVHSLFYNKHRVLSELSQIIDELEYQIRTQENQRLDGIKRVCIPEVRKLERGH